MGWYGLTDKKILGTHFSSSSGFCFSIPKCFSYHNVFLFGAFFALLILMWWWWWQLLMNWFFWPPSLMRISPRLHRAISTDWAALPLTLPLNWSFKYSAILLYLPWFLLNGSRPNYTSTILSARPQICLLFFIHFAFFIHLFPFNMLCNTFCLTRAYI